MFKRALVGCGLIALALGTVVPEASSSESRTFTRTSYGYLYKRGDITFRLRDRNKEWTRAEAEIIRDCLDRLPEVLLDKSMDMRVRTFYRDARPIGRRGKPRKATVSATTVIEEGWIAMGDRLFEGMRTKRIYRTVTHELGHVAQYATVGGSPRVARAKATAIGTPGWTSISWTSVITDGLKSYNGFVSDYARSDDDREDFAESVEFYWLNPDELRRVSPRKYRYMRDVVFEGVVSPAESRDLSHEAIDRVEPRITRLGDRSDDALSLVKVHGEFFMGPLDGGYNRVRFRGRRAVHLSVSRSTIWSWVPAIRTGSAPVTVTTQDGKSGGASFKVTKPWWKFW
jgi:hypothetical protein